MDKDQIAELDDSELDEWFDSFLETYGELIREEQSGVSVVDQDAMKRVECVYGIAQYIARKSNAKVWNELHSPQPSDGAVYIEAKELTVTDTYLFGKMVSLSDTVEIDPTTYGVFRFGFGFNNLTKKIG